MDAPHESHARNRALRAPAAGSGYSQAAMARWTPTRAAARGGGSQPTGSRAGAWPAETLAGRTRPLPTWDGARIGPLLAILIAAGVGIAAAVDPTLTLVLLVGVGVAAVMLGNLTAGVLVFVVATFLESLPTLEGAPSIAKLLGLFLVVGWLAALTLNRPGLPSLDFAASHLGIAWLAALFLAWVMASSLWAEDVSVSRAAFVSFALNLALFAVVFAAVRTPRHVVWLAFVFVVGSLLAVAGGLAAGGVGDEGDRLSGSGLNPNVLGAVLAVSVVLSATLALMKSLHRAARVAAGLACLLCVASLLLTGSRGAMLGLAAALVLAPFVVGRGRRAATAALVAATAVGLWVALNTVAPESAADRLVAVTSTGSGRVDLWTIAGRMIDDRPFIGVGADNYRVTSVHYLLEPGTIVADDYIVDNPVVPHNIYLQVFAELGVVGLTLYLALVLACLACFLRAARIFERGGNRDAGLLARGLLIALMCLLVALVFSSALYSKQLYLLLAVGPAMLSMARHAARPPSTSS